MACASRCCIRCRQLRGAGAEGQRAQLHAAHHATAARRSCWRAISRRRRKRAGARRAGGLRADVLLAPHHGSGTSSTPAFLQAVHPSVGVFQVGYRNRYKHPKKEVYERYGQLGIAAPAHRRSWAPLTLDFDGGIAYEATADSTPLLVPVPARD
jgi:hypothetical protein